MLLQSKKQEEKGMEGYQVCPIGSIVVSEEGTWLKLRREYIPALEALEGFRHMNVLWWFSDFDGDAFRKVLQVPQPYKDAPQVMGVFATRSPIRPNPIALTTCEVLEIDRERGMIKLAFIDANHASPVLDIKPYTPSLDRVETPGVPAWCAGWPKSAEASGHFDWEAVFRF